MFGGLTKTSSRIAIAAALGMTLGGFAMGASPAKAADLGGDCCADLEERVAELEATTVRKGNKKVSVTLSGWVVDSINWWDDGRNNGFAVGSKDITLASHFTISGSATIAPGWTGGYNITIEAPGNAFGFFSNQFNANSGTNAGGALAGAFGNYLDNVLQSYMWLKSDRYGTINWGLLSPATDNVALLPDLSGTIIESNAVLFEGPGFFLSANGTHASGTNTLQALTWSNFTHCDSVAPIAAGIGTDCNTSLPVNAVRYDSPTFWGFSISTSAAEQQTYDVAVKYAADWWSNWKVSAAFGYTKQLDENYGFGTALQVGPCNSVFGCGFKRDDDTFEVGASIMHVPSGLWLYGMYQAIDINGTNKVVGFGGISANTLGSASNDSSSWFLKGGIKRTWTPLGATVIWGEGGQYINQFSGIAGTDICALGAELATGSVGGACASGDSLFVTGSTVNRVGAGVLQEIDSAAMHVYARWQQLNLDTTTAAFTGFGVPTKGNESFRDLNIFQVGGVIFF
jgi:hypothetical protein